MRIVCVADLHGFLPPVPACDLLVVAGDVCPLDDESPPAQRRWLRSTFARWLDDAPAAAIVGTPGNHDFVAVEEPEAMRELPWCCLIDESAELAGLVVHGSPWTPRFQEWAFMLDERGLAERWALIPPAVDVLVVHCPPAGYGDAIGGEPIGSPSLLAAIYARAPRLCVFGHVHQGYGRWRRRGTTLVNAAYCNAAYRPANEPVVLELPDAEVPWGL